jgi:precorrin-6A/cobalt-precorrin-6A reductase
MRILILAGTSEARQLAEQLAGRSACYVTVSYAGRTARPTAVPGSIRTGGFGGAQGLAAFLRDEAIDVMIDATHPYAAGMATNAAGAAEMTGVRFLALRRPPWARQPGDRWTQAADTLEALQLLGNEPRRIFLAMGRKELAPFQRAPQHSYLVRSVEPVNPPLILPHVEYVTARGPFAEADERALLTTRNIEVIVAKNSGGAATYAKIAAARALRIDVVLLRRPALPVAPTVETVEQAIDWLDHGAIPCAARGV